MKVACTQENLNRGLGIVNRIATTHATLPVLANILISSDKGRLKFSATDLEIGIISWIGAKIDEEGGLTVPARTLADFISTNADKKIDLEIKDTTLHIKSEHYEANLKGIEASEFPLIPSIKGDPIGELPAQKLKQAIVQTVFATSTDETRPVLGGVNLRFDKKEVKLVATDSYRLAEKTLKDATGFSQTANVVVPARTMTELARIIQDEDETIQVFLNENQILFALPDTQLISRLIEGTFPAYERIIPQSFQSKAVVSLTELSNALKMASLFARESANNIRLMLKKGTLEIVAISPQVGDNLANLPAETEGKELEIAFNARFILDALSVISSATVTLELNSIKDAERKPSILRPSQDKNYLYLIMPLDIQS